MNEKFLKEKKSQKILLSVMAALILILAVCAISTADTAIPENALTQCEPERIQDLDNGVQQIYFNIDQKNDGDSLVFFTLHQYVDVFADGERIYSLNQTGGVWGHTTGYVWCFVKLPKDVKQMEIRLTPCYPEVAGQMREYYIGSEHEIYRTLNGDQCIYIHCWCGYSALLDGHTQEQPDRWHVVIFWHIFDFAGSVVCK